MLSLPIPRQYCQAYFAVDCVAADWHSESHGDCGRRTAAEHRSFRLTSPLLWVSYFTVCASVTIMVGQCYFCHGIVTVRETGHLRLDDHSDHEVFVHEACAGGHGLVDRDNSGTTLEVECPECGAVEPVRA